MEGWRRATVLLALTLATLPTPSAAQGTDAGDGWRVGITVGGISTVGLTFELYRDSRSLDLTVGTFAFRDVGVSAVVKQYIGGRAARPFVGAGLWTVVAWPDEERTGVALVARVPVGLDWNFTGRHAIGGALTINRALAIRRPDPTDDRPLNERLVPLPGMYYRWNGS